MPKTTVFLDYAQWITKPIRVKSPEVDFGVWWKLTPGDQPIEGIQAFGGILLNAGLNARWRVSWIQDTGELYAKELSPDSERMIVLGHYPTREAVEAKMSGWAEGGAKALTEFFAGVSNA